MRKWANKPRYAQGYAQPSFGNRAVTRGPMSWIDLIEASIQRIDPDKLDAIRADAAVCFPTGGENALRTLIAHASWPGAIFVPDFAEARRHGSWLLSLPKSVEFLILVLVKAMRRGEYVISGIDPNGNQRDALAPLIARGEDVELFLSRAGIASGLRIGGVTFTGVRLQRKSINEAVLEWIRAEQRAGRTVKPDTADARGRCAQAVGFEVDRQMLRDAVQSLADAPRRGRPRKL